MKKIIFMPIPMQTNLQALYTITQETAKKLNLDNSKKINYPINAYISDYLNENDELKICFIELTDNEGNSELAARCKQNEILFQNELQAITKPLNVKLEYKTVKTSFSESADIFGSRFEDLYKCLEKNCEIYADITFGAKTNTLILNNILNFAEQFFDCNVEAIVYGKTIFTENKEGKTTPNQSISKVCDVTSLYYLTKLTNHIKADSPEEAIKKVKKYLKL